MNAGRSHKVVPDPSHMLLLPCSAMMASLSNDNAVACI